MKILPTALALAPLGACTTVPAMEYRYAPAVGVTTISVVQSLACSTDDQTLVISNAQPIITATYQADRSQTPWSVTIKNDNSNLADTNFTMGWWDDGRLKSVNSAATGQGTAAIKALVSLVGTALTVGSPRGSKTAVPLKICTELKRLNKDGVVAITYTRQFDLASLNSSHQEIPPSSSSSDLYADLNALRTIGPMTATLSLSPFDTRPAIPQVAEADQHFIWLKLQKVQYGTLEVYDQQGKPISSTQIVVPDNQLAHAWSLPIPKAKPFGNGTFGVAVAESGMVTSVSYAKNASMPAALDVLNAAATSLGPRTDADRLAALKAQDDLIVENNRHARCVAQQDQCT